MIDQHKNITIYEHYHAVDIILKQQCVGIYALNIQSNNVETFVSRVVILATGGASWVYQCSSNPFVSSGDGIAMAYRAGVVLAPRDILARAIDLQMKKYASSNVYLDITH